MIHSIVFERQPNVAAVLQQILATARGLAPTETTSDWSYARRRIAALDSPVVVLGPDAEDADLQSALTIMGELPATSFVLVADELDAPTLQRAMRSGIRDVVSVEMAEIDLPAAVVRAHAISVLGPGRAASAQRGSTGKAIAIFGKGGTGKTFLATNLAIRSAESGHRTVLLDGVRVFGDTVAALRVRPERTFFDVAGIAGQLDESVLSPVVTKHPSGLEVLAAPSDPAQASQVPASVLPRIMDGLRKSYELVFVDTGPTLDAWTSAALEAADLAYLVTTLDLAAVKHVRACLGMLEDLRVQPERLRVVLNRANSRVEFPLDEARKALGRKVDIELDSDVAVPRSINRGVPVHREAPRARVSRQLEAFANELQNELLPSTGERKKRSMLSRPLRARPSES